MPAYAAAAAVVGLAGVGRAETVESRAGLASAAVDTNLFREGAVRRTNVMFGKWSLDCDEILQMRQRYCSMRTLGYDANGAALLRLTLSTDETGRPAALLDLPLGIDLTSPIQLAPDRGMILERPSQSLKQELERPTAGTSRTTPAGTRRIAASILTAELASAICDASGCHAVWGLSPFDIAALRAGLGIRIRFRVAERGAMPFWKSRSSWREVSIFSDGLDAALLASVR